MCYQEVVPDILDLLGSPRAKKPQTTATSKVKWSRRTSKYENPSKKSKVPHSKVPVAIPVVLTWSLTPPLQASTVVASEVGEGSFEPCLHIRVCSLWRELPFHPLKVSGHR